MELVSGKCVLCGVEDKVFNKNVVFAKQIQNSFFSTNKDGCPEGFKRNLALCVLCVHKVQLSFDIKKAYDEMCNRNRKRHKNKCLFCESRTNILVDTGENACDFVNKMKIFLSSVVVYHSYESMSSCVRCLYNLSVWLEVRTQLWCLMNLPEIIPRNEDVLPSNLTSTPVIKRVKRSSRIASRSDKKKKTGWKAYLRWKLSHLKTVNESMTLKNATLQHIENAFNVKGDDKLFNKIPYVSISICSQVSKDMLAQADAFETITIVDSEDDAGSHEAQRLGTSLSKHNEKSKSLESRRKSPFKIKFSTSFSKSLRLRINYPHTCRVCDKGFHVRCDYLLHLLKHEKMESLVINLIRYNLPPNIKAHEFEEICKEKRQTFLSVSLKNINQLLAKWIGDHAGNTFDDANADSENSKSEVPESNACANQSENTDDSGNEDGDVTAEDEAKEEMIKIVSNSTDSDKTGIENMEVGDDQVQVNLPEEQLPTNENVDEDGHEGDKDLSESKRMEEKGKVNEEEGTDETETNISEPQKLNKVKLRVRRMTVTEDERINEEECVESDSAQEESQNLMDTDESESNNQANIINNEYTGTNIEEDAVKESGSNDCEGSEKDVVSDETPFSQETITDSEKADEERSENETVSQTVSETDPRESSSPTTVKRGQAIDEGADGENREKADECFSTDGSDADDCKTKLTCEDLLTILGSNLEDEAGNNKTTKSASNNSNSQVRANDDESYSAVVREDSIERGSAGDTEESRDGVSRKRTMCTKDDSDEGPRRKRVRFTIDKEILTPDKSVAVGNG